MAYVNHKEFSEFKEIEWAWEAGFYRPNAGITWENGFIQLAIFWITPSGKKGKCMWIEHRGKIDGLSFSEAVTDAIDSLKIKIGHFSRSKKIQLGYKISPILFTESWWTDEA